LAKGACRDIGSPRICSRKRLSDETAAYSRSAPYGCHNLARINFGADQFRRGSISARINFGRMWFAYFWRRLETIGMAFYQADKTVNTREKPRSNAKSRRTIPFVSALFASALSFLRFRDPNIKQMI
jgi:hypothetical protein